MGNEYCQMINLCYKQQLLLGERKPQKIPTLQNVYESDDPFAVLCQLLTSEMNNIRQGNDLNYGTLSLSVPYACELFEFLKSDDAKVFKDSYLYPNSDFLVPMEFLQKQCPTVDMGSKKNTISVSYAARSVGKGEL